MIKEEYAKIASDVARRCSDIDYTKCLVANLLELLVEKNIIDEAEIKKVVDEAISEVE